MEIWQIEVVTDNVKDRTVVFLAGEFDVVTADQLRETFLRSDVISANRVTVNLRQVSLLDSSIVSVLVAACKRVRSTGAQFDVTCGIDYARRLLETEGLVAYFNADA